MQIDGQSVMFYDDNLDGCYKLADDTFRVGGADAPIDVFAPMSQFFSTGRSIYHIDSLAQDGTTLKYSAYRGPMGQLAVDCAPSDWSMVAALGDSKGEMNLVSDAGAVAHQAVAVIPVRTSCFMAASIPRRPAS